MGAVCHFVSTSTLPVLGGYFPGPVGSEHLSWDEQGVYFLLPRLSLNAGLDKADLSQNSDGWHHLKVNLPFLWATYTRCKRQRGPCPLSSADFCFSCCSLRKCEHYSWSWGCWRSGSLWPRGVTREHMSLRTKGKVQNKKWPSDWWISPGVWGMAGAQTEKENLLRISPRQKVSCLLRGKVRQPLLQCLEFSVLMLPGHPSADTWSFQLNWRRERWGPCRSPLPGLVSPLILFFLPVILWPLAMRRKPVLFPWALRALYCPRESVSAGPVQVR